MKKEKRSALMVRIAEKAVQRILMKFGYAIYNVKSSPLRLWEDDSNFMALMQQIKGYTLVDNARCFMISQLSRQAYAVSGDVAEIGVYKGGTAKLLARLFEGKNKTVHLFDTFSGMPPADPGKDIHKENDFSDTSLENVMAFMHDCKNVRFYKGVFPATAKPLEASAFCLVHIDVDIYKSAMDCCTFFYPRMNKGGAMIFDDYGFLSCPGIKMAVDEYFLGRPEKPLYLPTGQCVVIRF